MGIYMNLHQFMCCYEAKMIKNSNNLFKQTVTNAFELNLARECSNRILNSRTNHKK
jgi:hypothetical protein